MPQIGPLELIIVLVIVIIVFGVGKLPEIGGALGRGIKEFRGSVRDESGETPSQVESKAKEVEAKPKSEA